MPASHIARRLAGVFLFASIPYAPTVAAQVAPPPLEAYGELPTLEDMTISDAGQIAMLTTVNGKRLLVVVDQSMKPKAAMEVGDIKVRGIRWVGEETIVILRSDTQELGWRFVADKFEFRNAMILPADGQGDIQTVFSNDRSMLNSIWGVRGYRHIGGKWIGYFGGIAMTMGQAGNYYFDSKTRAGLYAVDLKTNKARKVAASPSGNEYYDWLLDERGEILATLTFNDANGAWRIVNERRKEIASGNMPKGGGELMSFNVDGTKAIYDIFSEHGDDAYYEVSLDGSDKPKRIFADVDIDVLFTDRSDSRIIGYLPSAEEENDDPVFFDPAAQEKIGKVISAFRPVDGKLQSWTPDFGRILLTTAGNNDSGTWYLINTVEGRADVIGYSRPQIRANQVGPISTVHYKAQDGLEIEGVLTLPPGREAKSLPVIIFPHGGPRAHDEATFDWWAQAFASRGYAVLQPNFRGSTGYGDDFLHAGDGQWGKKMQSDLSDGLAFLAEQGIVDPQRACIMGASYGGYAAMAGISLQQGVYRCSVAVAGVSDLELFVRREFNETGSRELKDAWLEMMGSQSNLDEVSPRHFADKADAPILLIHGRNDTIVPYQQSRVMADALKSAGKPFELVDLGEEDHNLAHSATRKQMLEAAMAFVEKYNPAD